MFLFAFLFPVRSFRQLRVHVHGGVVGEDDHARFGTAWFFHVPDGNEVHRHVLGFLALAVVCSDGGYLIDNFLRDVLRGLIRLQGQDNVRSRYILGVEPQVPLSGHLCGEVIVFLVVSAHEDLPARRQSVFDWVRLGFFSAETLLGSLANVSRILQLLSNLVQFFQSMSAFNALENGFQIEDILRGFFQLVGFLVNRRLRLGILFEIILSILGSGIFLV